MNTRNKKIIVLHVILSLAVGGMEQVVADLVEALDKGRFTPVVACLELLGEIADEISAKGIKVIKVPAMTPGISFFYPAPLVKVIRKTGADIVHAHSGCWLKAAIAARLAGVGKVVYTEHGRAFPDSASRIMQDRLSSRMTDSVVAVSSQLGEYLRKVVRIPSGKVSVIINGIDTERFLAARDHRDGEELRIGAVARLEPVKDLATLLRAMKLVSGECPAVALDIAGTGTERDALARLADDLGIGGMVRFHGLRRDIPELLAELDIYALSSLSEGTSIAIMEAMAAGLPVVATRVGGNPSLIEEGKNGFLVPAGEPSALANALIRLAMDAGLRLRMGAANREKARMEYGIGAMAARYERLYDSLLAAEPAGMTDKEPEGVGL